MDFCTRFTPSLTNAVIFTHYPNPFTIRLAHRRRLKKHERVQTTALRSTSEELYQTQNQLALVQTSIVQAPEAENHLDRETIDALRTQLDELGGIKMMRDEEANRIIFELEEELDCKEKELEELKQSSLTQGEREGWEELVKMRGEEVEKTERKFMEILEGKQGEIEELQTTISRKDAQLKAGDANFKKYQETLDEVGASSSERARGEAIDLMGQLKEACEENTKVRLDEERRTEGWTEATAEYRPPLQLTTLSALASLILAGNPRG